MTLRTRLAGWLLGKDVNDQLQQAITMTNMGSAPRRGTAELIQMYRVSPWLQAVTKKIGQRFASTTWELYALGSERRGWSKPGGLKHAAFDDRQKQIRRLKQAGELTKIEAHPMLTMLNTANPFMTGTAGRMLTQLYRDISGEAFWALGMSPLNVPDEFWPIPPSWVTETPESADGFYTLTVEGRPYKLPQADVLWFREPDPADPYGRGAGTAESLTDEIETDEYAAHFIKTFFRNRARPELIISVEGMDQDQLRLAKQQFENQHLGYQRAHRSWWQNSKIDVRELTQKFTDMELQALREAERDTVINVFGVPPEQLGIVTSSNRATAHESENIMAVSVLVPRLESMREQLQAELVPRYDERLILDYVSPVPADREFQLRVMTAAPYQFTRGDWRELASVEDRGEGDDVHLTPLNLMEIQAPETDASGSANVRALPEARKSIDQNGIGVVLDALQPEYIRAEVMPVWTEEMEEWGDRALDDLNIEPRFDMQNPLVTEHLAEFGGDRVMGINDQTRTLIQGELIEGMQDGEGVRDLAKRITGRFAWMNETRARIIARTESVRSSSFATLEAFRQSGIVEGKEWLHTPDELVRPLHAELGMQPAIPISDDFRAGGFAAPHPGEFGVAEMDINCRCAMAPVVDMASEPRSAEVRESVWKVNESERMTWERSAAEAFRRGFARQETAALEALRRVST